jgi:high-affinity Fe2+/Pb2+ permease
MNKLNELTRRNLQRVAALGALMLAPAAFAQTAPADYGAATAIASTQVVVLAIIAGFITMGIAVWGARYILRRFFPQGK